MLKSRTYNISKLSILSKKINGNTSYFIGRYIGTKTIPKISYVQKRFRVISNRYNYAMPAHGQKSGVIIGVNGLAVRVFFRTIRASYRMDCRVKPDSH